MKKYVVMALISSFIGIMSNPEVLTASDRVPVNGVSDAGMVETVELPEISDSGAAMIDGGDDYSVRGHYASATSNNVSYYASVDVSVAQLATSVSYISTNNIQIAGRIIEVVPGGVGDSGTHVNMDGRLLKGHNSQEVFGGLSGVGVGSTFTVTLSGVTTTYRVADKITYDKATLDSQVNYLCNYGRKICSGNLMYQLKDVTDTEIGHNLILMTCAGEMYGNGDASHRLVIFADAI